MDRWLQRAHGGQNRALISVLILLFGFLFSNFAMGMPAYPGPVSEQQPDGSNIELRIRGDEHFNWMEDANGYTVIQNGGWFQYAQLDQNGNLTTTGANVGQVSPQALGLQQRILPSPAILAQSALNMPVMSGDVGVQQVPPLGTVKNLVVMVRFSNHTGRTQPSVANVDVLMNSPTPDPTYAPTGSVKAVYLENSYGQMTLESTVAPWVTVSNTEQYYANGNSGDSTLWEALREALDTLDATINFNDFDTDSDGFIDSITFLHSGYGAEWGGNDAYGTNYVDRIWSHRWSIQPSWQSNEGVRVGAYHISPAVWGTSGSAIGRIGVIAHETGHFFGLPDLYDTDGSGSGIGSWGLMANSWDFNFTQQCPPHFSPWSKVQLGWYSPTVITNPGQYSLNQAETNAEAYRIDSGFPNNEYLMIENRQNAGFDCTIPQGGLVIWHMDDDAGYNTEGYPGQGGWPGNGNHYRVAVLAADGNYDLEKDNNRGDAGDVHHGAGVDAIGPSPGHPNTDTYQGGVVTQTGHIISDISASGPNMTFCLNGCSGLNAPSSMNATAAGSFNINLTWNDNSPDEDGFNIERSLNGTTWSPLASVGADVTAYGDSGLNSGTTYYYRAQAFNVSDTSGWSNTANATTTDVPPASPTGLNATTNGTDQIDLVWTDASGNEDGFRIERSTSAGSGFAAIASVGAGVENYSNTGLSASTTYYYRVYAFNGAGDSATFTAADARTDDPPPVVTYVAYADQFGSGLVTGTYVSTHTGNGVNQSIEEKVSGGKKRDRTTFMGHFWRFNISSGDEIRVFANAYQSVSGDGDNFVFSWSGDDSTYTDLFTVSSTLGSNNEMATIPNSVSGEVWIRVIDTDRTPGNSTSRDTIFVDHLYIEVENFGPPTVPANPTALSMDNQGFTSLDISWTDNSNNEDNFRVEGSDDGSAWSEIATVGANTTSYSETGLANGQTRHYRVRAWNGVGFSAEYTNVVSGTTLAPETPPADPTIVSAVANAHNSMTVTWVDESDNEIGFRIRRSLNDSSWTTVASIGSATTASTGNTTMWEDTTVVGGTLYYYQVQAFNSVDSAWTTSVSDTTPTDPGGGDIDLTASGFKDKGKKNFNLSWTNSDGGNVAVYLDGNVAANTTDDGSYTLSTNLKGGGSHDLQVCETDGDLTCSDVEVVTF